MGDTFWVYIMTNKTRTVLYTGMTNDIVRRVWEHRLPTGTGFAARYSCNRLVYWRQLSDRTRCHRRGEAHQGLAADQEGHADLGTEPELERSCGGLV